MSSTYCATSDVILQYGHDNVWKWADLDNRKDEDDILARIAWAIAGAGDELDARLLNGPYAIPFTEPFHSIIISMAAQYTGVLLYEGRGVQDMSEDGKVIHKLMFQKKAFECSVKDLLTRRLKLGIDTVATSYPQVIPVKLPHHGRRHHYRDTSCE